MKIVASNIVDPTQFEEKSPYYDRKSTRNAPRWQTVRVEFVRSFDEIITLQKLKQEFKPDELLLIKKGNRLSVMPVSQSIAKKILSFGK
jgi:predicted RNA-binding protein with PUA-like domain